MTPQQKTDFITYKMARSNECLVEAELSMQNNMLHLAVNRLYYACFYAVGSLLLKDEIQVRKHSGVKQMFGLHYISTDIISKESGKFYTEIFNNRQKGDYDALVFFEIGDVKQFLASARKLIKEVEVILSNSHPL